MSMRPGRPAPRWARSPSIPRAADRCFRSSTGACYRRARLRTASRFGRVEILLSLLTGSIIGLALLAQVERHHEVFTIAAFMLMSVVLLAGLATIARLTALNRQDLRCVLGMKPAALRLPGPACQKLEPYMLPAHDPDQGAAVQLRPALRAEASARHLGAAMFIGIHREVDEMSRPQREYESKKAETKPLRLLINCPDGGRGGAQVDRSPWQGHWLLPRERKGMSWLFVLSPKSRPTPHRQLHAVLGAGRCAACAQASGICSHFANVVPKWLMARTSGVTVLPAFIV